MEEKICATKSASNDEKKMNTQHKPQSIPQSLGNQIEEPMISHDKEPNQEPHKGDKPVIPPINQETNQCSINTDIKAQQFSFNANPNSRSSDKLDSTIVNEGTDE
ncbi:hypothetical protein ACH5RR_026274 [Cinchona calisaya]|uniref:Uncharacterized protein n=1 Tax=Cinchona calisaya TaxID=153742 RepID=A0ABD2Z639_9GENT